MWKACSSLVPHQDMCLRMIEGRLILLKERNLHKDIYRELIEMPNLWKDVGGDNLSKDETQLCEMTVSHSACELNLRSDHGAHYLIHLQVSLQEMISSNVVNNIVKLPNLRKRHFGFTKRSDPLPIAELARA